MNQPSTPDSDLSPWAAAVAALVPVPGRKKWEAPSDAAQVLGMLNRLAATGDCLAVFPGGAQLLLEDVRMEEAGIPGTNSAWLRGRKPSPPQYTDHALALIGRAPDGTRRARVVRIGPLTYFPGMARTPAERDVFHLLSDRLPLGSPFTNARHADTNWPDDTAYLSPEEGAVLFCAGDFDVHRLFGHLASREGAKLTDRETVEEAVRGDIRASYVPAEVRAAREHAIAEMRREYEAGRADRPTSQVRQEDIDVIVRIAQRHAIYVNMELVHAVTDRRGSPASVMPKIIDATARFARADAMADADPHFVRAWDALKAEAIHAGRAEVAIDRDALTRAENELAARADALAERERTHAAAVESHAAFIDGLNAQIATATAEAERLKADLARERAEKEQLTMARNAALAELKEAERTAGRLYDEKTDLNDRLGKAEARAATVTGEREQWRTAALDAQLKLADSESRLIQTVERHTEVTAERKRQLGEALDRTAQLRGELDRANERVTALERERADLAARVATAEASAAALAAELDRARDRGDAAVEQISSLKDAIGHLTVDLRVAERERDTLATTLASLSHPSPDQ